MSRGGIIGVRGDLPWRLSDDLKRFKRLTMGHPIIMGRRTYDSIGRPLPGRRSIVITRQAGIELPGVTVVHSFAAALDAAHGTGEVFVIGGGEIYQIALPKADRIYLTLVDAELEGDTRFPEIDWSEWEVVEESHGPADEKNDYAYRFQVLHRR